MSGLRRLGVKRPTDYKIAFLLIELLVFAIGKDKFNSKDAINFFNSIGIAIHIRTMQRMIKRLYDAGLITQKEFVSNSGNIVHGNFYYLTKKIGEIDLCKIDESHTVSNVNIILYIIKDSSQKNNMRLSTSFLLKVFSDFGMPTHKRKAQRMLVTFSELGIIDIVKKHRPTTGEAIFIIKNDVFERIKPIIQGL